ncbi:hypothetical protein ACTI_30980 [Actinoplanes sp. OR16]|uniref:hypothetical protein n=1 Tax=Actinoplanes sp. OR16 TaxID=946334 RepID=UPI000F6E1EFF|nr:hypothetical protein [Actinoplanes sp. OR16]BBH66413.1 hypothetical protein ACTI_30980 [Actinoplanes sp. OR16]
MNRNRIAAATALLIAGATTAACGTTGGPAAAPTVEKTKTVTETLLDAVPDASSPVFHYTVEGGLNPFSGVIDPAGRAMTAEITQKVPDTPITLSMRFLVVEEKIWTKIAFTGATADLGLPKLPKKWMAIDPAKTGDSDVSDMKFSAAEIDPGYVTALVSAAAGLTQTTAGHFTGTTDLTRSTEAEIVGTKELTALGEQAKTAPLDVVVDADGRIAKATVKIPEAADYEVTYDRYGAAKPLTTPADAVKAPAAVYELLKG